MKEQSKMNTKVFGKQGWAPERLGDLTNGIFELKKIKTWIF